MASGSNRDQNNKGHDFRPQYGCNRNGGPAGTYRDTNQHNHNFSSNNGYPGRQQQENYTSTIYNNQYASRAFSPHQQKVKDDEVNSYAVNLQLKPVEMGITAKNDKWEQTFKGLGAFNHYFGLCAPNKNLGYTLPDIWDGYFHITLAKFSTCLTPDKVEEAFRDFNPSLKDLPDISRIVFRTTNIITGPGTYRPKGRQNIDFVIVPVDYSTEIDAFYKNVQSLLQKIEIQAKATKWYVTPLNLLHVTVRKYSNLDPDFQLSKIKLRQFPLEFHCPYLEIKQTREQATDRYQNPKNNRYRWWTGVTEINGKCSGCKAPVMPDVWEGFCLACGKYESIIPVWSTDGKDTTHFQQIQKQELEGNNNTLSELVQKLNLN